MEEKSIIEIGKLLANFFQLLATLSTGMLGLIITIVEKVFTAKRIYESRRDKNLLIFSLASFIFSLILSLIAIVEIPTNVNNMISGITKIKWVSPILYFGSISFFCLGVLLFVIIFYFSFNSNSTLTPDDGPLDENGEEEEVDPINNQEETQ